MNHPGLIHKRVFVGALTLLTFWRLTSYAAPGDVDPTFNANWNSWVRAVQIQSNGQILAGGAFTNINGLKWTGIVRLLPDGSLDHTFVVDTGASNTVYCLAIQPDHKIIIGGNFTSINGTNRTGIARLNPDGSLDPDFDPVLTPVPGLFGAQPAAVRCIAIQTNGAVLVAGSFTAVDGTSRTNIARINPDGSLDSHFDPIVSGGIECIASQNDDRVILGGTVSRLLNNA